MNRSEHPKRTVFGPVLAPLLTEPATKTQTPMRPDLKTTTTAADRSLYRPIDRFMTHIDALGFELD